MRAIALFLSAAAALLAQSSGRLSGSILDPNAAAVPHAAVTVINPATAAKRATTADAEGRYFFPDLPIGLYDLEVQAAGFAPRRLGRISLTVASALRLDVQLSVAATSDSVDVVDRTPAIEPQSANGVMVSARALREVPINGRDYGRLSLLAPGAVSPSTSLGDLSFNGLHPGHNNFTMDGVDVSRGDQPTTTDGFSRGARLLTGSIDTMAEFRIQTSNYRAEYGRAAGSVVTIATRSGGNDFHGGLFEFFRNSALDARNFFNTVNQPKDQFRYNNFGGHLAGPIRRDKTFFFLNTELSRQRQGVRGSGTVPSAAMREQVLRASPSLAFLLENFPPGDSPTANPLVANYSRFQSLAVDENTGSLRIDHNFSERDRLFARLNMNNSLVDGPLFSLLPSALGATDFQFVPSKSRNAVINYQRTVSPRTLLELTAGLQRTMTEGSSETPYPQVTITGFTVVPGSRRLNLSNATVFQYGGSLSHVRGAHAWKAGLTFWRTHVNSWTTSVVSLLYLTPQDFINNRLQQATLTAGTFGNGVRQSHLGLYLQDTWQLRPGLTLDLGLRYDFSAPNTSVGDRLRAFDIRSGALGAPGAPWYAADRDNFAPRAALAWQLDSRTALRAGYGIFFQQYPGGAGNNLAQNTLSGNSQLVRQQIPDLSWPLDRFVANAAAVLPVANGFNFDKPDLYAQQWNFTLLRELPGGFGLEAAYTGNRGINIRRSYNTNWIDPALGRRPLPQFSRVTVEYGNGQSVYHGLQLAARRRLGSQLTMTFSYAYAKAIDNVQDATVGAAEPQDFRCLSCERGLGSTDVRHNASFSAVWTPSWKRNSRLLGGWGFSAIGLIRSGLPLNVTQALNTVGSDNLTNQRPDRVLGVPVFPARPTPDLWLNPAAFVPAPRGRFGTSGRNPLSGPGFAQIDLAVHKQILLTERLSAQLRGEFFNLPNHPNFAAPNTVAGTPNFGRIFNTFGRTIGAGTSRQIQLGLRLGF